MTRSDLTLRNLLGALGFAAFFLAVPWLLEVMK